MPRVNSVRDLESRTDLEHYKIGDTFRDHQGNPHTIGQMAIVFKRQRSPGRAYGRVIFFTAEGNRIGIIRFKTRTA